MPRRCAHSQPVGRTCAPSGLSRAASRDIPWVADISTATNRRKVSTTSSLTIELGDSPSSPTSPTAFISDKCNSSVRDIM
eukprot:2322228-Rhodomonas_salina.1